MSFGTQNGSTKTDTDLDRLIARRHRERVAEEGERPAEALWRVQERLRRIELRAENQAAHIEAIERGIRRRSAEIVELERQLRYVKSLVPDGSPPRRGGIWTHSHGFYGGEAS